MKTLNLGNPEQWTFIAIVWHYEDSKDYFQEVVQDKINAMIETNHMDGNNIPWWNSDQARAACTEDSRYYVKGTCDHCGAHFNYGAAYRNDQGEVAIIGNVCASNKLCLTEHKYLDKKLRTLVQTARTRAKNEMLKDTRAKLVQDFKEPLKSALLHDHSVCQDIYTRYLKWGNLSEAQRTLVIAIYNGSLTVTRAKGSPFVGPLRQHLEVVQGKKITITGQVIGFKEIPDPYCHSEFATILKMIVLDDRGFKVYGSVPINLSISKGQRIQFVANIEVSGTDGYFGFFKRPRKSINLTKVAA